MRTKLRIITGKFLVSALAICGHLGLIFSPTEVMAQDKAIVVNADQPNVWTLEQAHYLLDQMEHRNLDLKEKRPEDLGPNEINGLGFEVLQRLVDLGMRFDQAD